MSVILRNITKKFRSPGGEESDVLAVSDVSLEISEGEMVTLLGPSGCGKTTTLRIVAGFEFPDSGRVSISGVDVTDLPPNRRDTAMVFQSYAIFPHLNVTENVAFGLRLKRLDDGTVRKRVNAILDLVGLSGLAKRSPEQLSGGQQQRVALARAIVNEPAVLLFDEPLSNLDAKLREQMRLEIRRIQQSLNITSIYVTHDQSEAMSLSDRIVVMNNGVVRQVGTPQEIYNTPQDHFVAEFVGRVNFVSGTVAGCSDDRTVVSIAGGKVEIPRRKCVFDKGAALDLVIRPETVRLSRLNPDSTGVITGRVQRVVYLGSLAEYEVLVGDRVITSIVASPAETGLHSVGDEVQVSFSVEVAHALPAR